MGVAQGILQGVVLGNFYWLRPAIRGRRTLFGRRRWSSGYRDGLRGLSSTRAKVIVKTF